MKSIVVSLVMACMTVGASAADVVTAVFNVNPPMSCDNCENKIKNNMRYETGVKNIATSLDKQEVTVSYDPSKTSPEQLAQGFKKIGYEATVANAKNDNGKCNNIGKCDNNNKNNNNNGQCANGGKCDQKVDGITGSTTSVKPGSCCNNGNEVKPEEKSCCKNATQNGMSSCSQCSAKADGQSCNKDDNKTKANSKSSTKTYKKSKKKSNKKSEAKADAKTSLNTGKK